MAQSTRSAIGGSVTPAASRPLSTPRSGLIERLASERLAPLTIVAAAMVIGGLLRLALLGIGDGFPLNDGGMFFSMIEDVRHGAIWPEYTSYNGGDIPFAYPPLPMIVAAGLTEIGGWSTLDLLRYWPLLFSLLIVPAAYLLARAMLPARLTAALAALIFATIPRAFDNEILGGGLTRSPGFFFASLALWQGYLLFQNGRRQHLVATALLASLAIYCHMEMGWFAGFSVALFFLMGRRQRSDLVNLLSLGGLVLLLTSPWWLTVLSRFGTEPLLSAAQTGDHSPVTILRLLTLHFSNDLLFPVATALGLLGLMACLRDRRYLLPLWLLVIFLLDPRKATTTSTLPIAMMAAGGLVEVVWPLLRSAAREHGALWPRLAVGFLLLVYAPAAAVMSANGDSSSLHAVSAAEREAMAWAGANTPDGARFVVMPTSKRWADDAAGEWFPALSNRVSLSTVQGAEWLGKQTFDDRRNGYDQLRECTGADAACLEAWAADYETSFDYVFVSKGKTPVQDAESLGERAGCCAPLIASLQADANYEMVYENEGAAVLLKLR